MSHIIVNNLQKSWGDNEVIKHISFDVPEATFTVLLGPSGCGKSTVLRLIAGLETASGGNIQIGGREVLELDASKRGISMVFQSYALFPHLNVKENILFGLKVRKVSKQDQEKRMLHAASTVGLSDLLDRKPSQLSGGQRQRIALARAIVSEQPVCLMDEPLSNLDAKLRAEMRSEIVSLQKSLGLTMVYVTHDQVEAMTMADQIILLRDGIIEQMGSPQDLYERPQSAFVASFIGTPPMNIIKTQHINGSSETIAEMINLRLSSFKTLDSFGIRPEDIQLVDDDGIAGKVQSVDYLGGQSIVQVSLDNTSLIVMAKGKSPLVKGQPIFMKWSHKDSILFDKNGISRKEQ